MAGSIHQDKKTKKWFFMLEVGRDELGKRKQKKKGGFKTKSEAKLALALAEVEISNGSFVEPSELTITTYMEEWLEERKNTVRESTYIQNCNYFYKYMQPYIGDIKLSELNPILIQRLINKLMSEKTLKPSTVNKTLQILNTCLNKAKRFKLIRDNPIAIVDKPKQERPQTEVWSIEQINEFLQKAKNRHNYIGYLIALTTGMRKGEVLGLRWKDIDFDKKTIFVNQALSPTGKKFENGKTKNSIRSIHMPQVLVDELVKHYQNYLRLKVSKNKNWNANELVICTKEGTPVHPTGFVRGFKRAIKNVGLPEIRFHDLRHSHATTLLKKNVHPKLVQELLGHLRISITLDIYSHALPSMQKEVADTLDDIIVV